MYNFEIHKQSLTLSTVISMGYILLVVLDQTKVICRGERDKICVYMYKESVRKYDIHFDIHKRSLTLAPLQMTIV